MANQDLNKSLDSYIEAKRKQEGQYRPFFRRKQKSEELSSEKKLSKEEEEHLKYSEEDSPVVIEKQPWYKRIFNFTKSEKLSTDDDDEKDFKEEDHHVAQLEDEFEQEMQSAHEEEKSSDTGPGFFESLGSKIKGLFSSDKVQHEEEISDEVPEEELGYQTYDNSQEVDTQIKQGKYTKLRLYRPRLKSDIKNVLTITDNLLAKLPKDEKIKFMQSKDFELYKSVFKRYGIKDQDPTELENSHKEED